MGEIWSTYGKFNKCIGVENSVPSPKWHKNTPGTYQYTYLLTPWSKVLPEKLKRPELLKKFPAFMEPEGS
jgi:hypothetical protein